MINSEFYKQLTEKIQEMIDKNPNIALILAVRIAEMKYGPNWKEVMKEMQEKED